MKNITPTIYQLLPVILSTTYTLMLAVFVTMIRRKTFSTDSPGMKYLERISWLIFILTIAMIIIYTFIPKQTTC